MDEMERNSKNSSLPMFLKELADGVGGKIEEVCGPLPDGSGFAIMNLPLPENHWLTVPGENVPPMPMRVGKDDPKRKKLEADLRSAARYAIRVSTDNGRIEDFDPDAMVTNFVIGMLGYWIEDGLIHD